MTKTQTERLADYIEKEIVEKDKYGTLTVKFEKGNITILKFEQTFTLKADIYRNGNERNP